MSSIPQTKEELLLAISSAYTKIMQDYRAVPKGQVRACGVEGNIKGTVISVADTLAYLIGWGKLVLKWIALREKGRHVDFPETGYSWNQLGALAAKFHEEYSSWEYEELITEYERVITEIIATVTTLGNDELYNVTWYKKWTLGRMIQFNTSSPMKNMRTKIRRFIRSQA